MSERTYRVWMEKHESGWVTVTAPSEAVARDLAQRQAKRQWIENFDAGAIACDVELVTPSAVKS